MDGFALVVLERTLELVVDAMPPDQDPAVADGVNAIRRYLESPQAQNAASIQPVVMKLAGLAHDRRQFLIAARLEAFAREMHKSTRNPDV
jgi:hypothetical protein